MPRRHTRPKTVQRTFILVDRRVRVAIVCGEWTLHQPRDIDWLVASLSGRDAGPGPGDIWRPQVRGVVARGGGAPVVVVSTTRVAGSVARTGLEQTMTEERQEQ